MAEPRINFKKSEGKGRVQKISLDVGFSCPNRDGTFSRKGCSFCSPTSFVPSYCDPEKTLFAQIDDGIAFFSARYRCSEFLAYFQSHSGTYADFSGLKEIYSRALSHPKINGLVIATRPDCLGVELVSWLEELRKSSHIRVELGIESLDDRVLETINRCHTAEQSLAAIEQLASSGIEVCAHLVAGLPAETVASFAACGKKLSETGIKRLKLHHLQIVKGSTLGEEFVKDSRKVKSLTIDEFLHLAAALISNLRPDIVIERLLNRVPQEFLLAPIWGGIDENQMRKMLECFMKDSGLYQGCLI